MSLLLRDHPDIRRGLDHFLGHDPRFIASGLEIEDITARHNPDLTLACLAKTIVGQQLSVKAAATIWGRVHHSLDVNDTKSWDYLDDDELRSFGLSSQKIKYIRGLCQAISEQKIDLKRLQCAPDQEIIDALTSLKGFGLWSAHMILIFTLARPNIWPAGDLGVQEGVRLYRQLKDRPDRIATEKYGYRRFAPYASAAALLLWRLKDRT